jgi:hypothetical protein
MPGLRVAPTHRSSTRQSSSVDPSSSSVAPALKTLVDVTLRVIWRKSLHAIWRSVFGMSGPPMHSALDNFRVADQPSTIWPTPLKSRSTRADEAQDFVRPESGSGRYCFNPAAPFSTSVMGEPASSPTGTSRRKRWPIPLPTHFGAEATVIDG